MEPVQFPVPFTPNINEDSQSINTSIWDSPDEDRENDLKPVQFPVPFTPNIDVEDGQSIHFNSDTSMWSSDDEDGKSEMVDPVRFLPIPVPMTPNINEDSQSINSIWDSPDEEDENDMEPVQFPVPLKHNVDIEVLGEITHTASEVLGFTGDHSPRSVNSIPFGAAQIQDMKPESIHPIHTDEDQRQVMESGSIHSILSGADQKEDVESTYKEKVMGIALELVKEKAALKKIKREECWDRAETECRVHEMYKVFSARYKYEMVNEVHAKVVECKKTTKQIKKELQLCSRKKLEVKAGVIEFTAMADEYGVTSEDVLESIRSYQKDLRDDLKVAGKPWKIRLGMMDDYRQQKRQAREDAGLQRPMMSRIGDYMIHKFNKLINGRKYSIYSEL